VRQAYIEGSLTSVNLARLIIARQLRGAIASKHSWLENPRTGQVEFENETPSRLTMSTWGLRVQGNAGTDKAKLVVRLLRDVAVGSRSLPYFWI